MLPWLAAVACQLPAVTPGTISCTPGGAACPAGLQCLSLGSAGQFACGSAAAASAASSGSSSSVSSSSSSSAASSGASSSGTLGSSTGTTAASTGGSSSGGSSGSSGTGTTTGSSSTGGSTSSGGSGTVISGSSSSGGSSGCGLVIGEPCCAGTCTGPGLACVDGGCACTPSSCPGGCCDANGCELGDQGTACGGSGGLCAVCAAGFEPSCVKGQCCGGAGEACCAQALCGYDFSCLGSGCGSTTSCGAATPTVNADGGVPSAVAIDADPTTDATVVYWADLGDAGSGGEIGSVLPDGGSPATAALSTDPYAITLDPPAANLYWATPDPIDGGDIWTCALNAAHTCKTNPALVVARAETDLAPNLRVDDEGNLYWAQYKTSLGTNLTGFWTCNLDGGCANPVRLGAFAVTIARFLFDDSGNFYYTGRNGDAGLDEVVVLGADGGTTILFSNDAGAEPLVLAQGGGVLFWSYKNSSAISALTLADGGLTSLPTESGGCPDALAADAKGKLYWTDVCLGALYRLPACGSPLESLWSGGSTGSLFGTSLVLDSSRVYWTDVGRRRVYSMPR